MSEPRKNAEQAFQDYRAMVEKASSIILCLDREARITFVNEFALKFFGYTREELLGKEAVGTIVPALESTGRDLELMMGELCAHGESFVANQNENMRRDGSRVWISWTNRPLQDCQGNIVGILSVGNDLTEYRRAVEALKESESRFRTVFDRAPIGMVLSDLQGRAIRANRALEEILGYQPGEIEGLTAFDVTDPRDLSRTAQLIREVLAGQREYYQIEKRYLRKDGDPVWIKATGSLVRDSNGEPQFMVGMIEDITRRRQAEEVLDRERHTLRQLLEIQEHDRRLVGYEIHDGLAQYLSGALFLLQSYQHLRARNSPDAEETLKSSIQLLEQSMGEARRLVGGLRPVVLDELGIVAGIEYLIEQVESRGGPAVEFVAGELVDRLSPLVENALFRIAQEGLNNACRYGKSERVKIELARREGRVFLEIRDWGVGFDVEKVGAGHFGLEGMRERARLLGGQARIESTPGEGTRIIVELPESGAGPPIEP